MVQRSLRSEWVARWNFALVSSWFCGLGLVVHAVTTLIEATAWLPCGVEAKQVPRSSERSGSWLAYDPSCSDNQS